MPDITQDLLGLQYSQSFQIQGMQEADITLNLAPPAAASASIYRYGYGRHESDSKRNSQTV